MNGIGRLDRDVKVVGLFLNDRFVRMVEQSELGELRHYIE